MSTRLVDGRPAPVPTVVTLAEVGASDIGVAGGKGANLGELLRAGFRVPDGFVITTAAYSAALQAAPRASSPKPAPGSQAPDVSDALRADITAAYRRLGSGAVAVRSSATAEDLPGATFAGQQETYLNVVGEDSLLEAVRACWASLWGERAVSYRKRLGVNADEVLIAVVVQRMVPAEVAGVLFTANPLTGRRDQMVIDASAGLGESVVSGLVSPDHFLVNADGRLADWSCGGQEVVVTAAEGGGTTHEAGSTTTEPVLDPRQLGELAALGRRAVELFGRPQDIEWATAGDDLWVLQSRPMTALPPAPFRLNPLQRKVGPFFTEMFQQRPYPLDVSGWLRYGIEDMLVRMAGSVGVAFPPVSTVLPEEDGVVVRLVPPVPRPTRRVVMAPLSIRRRVRRFDAARWTADERFTEFQALVDDLNTVDTASLTWPELLEMIRRTFAGMGLITELRVSYLPSAFVPLLRLRLWLVVLGRLRLAPALVAGAETRTTQANRALTELAAGVLADARLRRLFEELEPAQLLEQIHADDSFAQWRSAFNGFLAEYGHRESVSVALSSSPTWSEAPELVLGIIRALLDDRPPETRQTDDAVAELTTHPALRVRRLRGRVLSAVHASRVGMGLREDTHFYATMMIPPLRRAILELGARLHRIEVLAEAGDVFHLRLEELNAVGDPDALPVDERERLRRRVIARAAMREELAHFPLLDPDLLFAHRPTVDGVLLSGVGASRGVATGEVSVVHRPAEFGKLRSGQILVCPYTNPSWTPLFLRAAAVVVDAGGLGSHAAIVAREYGIPAVMGTRNGTNALIDGQRVTVDGGRGIVTAGVGG
ncbi:PEP/pyruvate-binding domain-containing protein [Nakamurella sp. GG22]